MKGFSNQLIEKHRHVKHLETAGYSEEDVEKSKQEFDRLISCKQFLDVAGLELSTTTVSCFFILKIVGLRLSVFFLVSFH